MNPARTAGEARVLEHLVLAGWGKDVRTAPRAARVAASDALERWVRAGLPFARLDDGGRGFDPAEVMNFAKSAGVAGRDDFWATRYVATGRGLIREFGAPPHELGPRRVAVRLERAFNLEHHAPGTRVRLRVPFPAVSPSLTDLRIVALPPQAHTQPGYAETFVVVPQERGCVVSATYEFTAHASPVHDGTGFDAGELEPEVTSPRVAALAAELAENARTDRDAVRAFWNFFFERMMLGVLRDEGSLDAVLDSGWFDCRAGSALFVALCRARGIPARTCSGFTLYSVPFYHYWAEVRLSEEWFPIDLTCWDLSLRGTDEQWHDYFFGALDYRMTTEILPRTFTGFPSLRLPRAWHTLTRPLDGGAAFAVYAAETGTLVYEDRVTVNVNAGPLLP